MQGNQAGQAALRKQPEAPHMQLPRAPARLLARDHRRTGLPFWEIPVGSTEFPFLDGWTKESYKNGQKVGYYAQRMNYPNSFKNASPEEYQRALSHMGMTNENTVTPLWWAIQK